MAKSRKAKCGDCVVSMALEEGLRPDAVWNHPENEHLREGAHARPEIIAPGQKVHLKELERSTEDGAMDSRHVFRRRDVPIRLRVRLLQCGEPRGNLAYQFEVAGEARDGTTDTDGLLDEIIPFDATEAMVRLTDEHEGELYVFKIGYLDPVECLSGVQARLHNLGYNPGPIDNIMGPRTERAIKVFQKDHDLTITGEPDDETMDALVEDHKC